MTSGGLSRKSVSLATMSPADAVRSRDAIGAVYVASYTDAIASGDPFDSVDSFMARFDKYVTISGFSLVLAHVDHTPVAQTWGWPLPRGAESGWWAGLTSVPDPTFTHETGRRTFALSEIMVDAGWAGRGIARMIHDEILRVRTEERATLLVEPENHRAQTAYRKWGWQKVAQLRPSWDNSPLFDVMVRELRK